MLETSTSSRPTASIEALERQISLSATGARSTLPFSGRTVQARTTLMMTVRRILKPTARASIKLEGNDFVGPLASPASSPTGVRTGPGRTGWCSPR